MLSRFGFLWIRAHLKLSVEMLLKRPIILKVVTLNKVLLAGHELAPLLTTINRNRCISSHLKITAFLFLFYCRNMWFAKNVNRFWVFFKFHFYRKFELFCLHFDKKDRYLNSWLLVICINNSFIIFLFFYFYFIRSK